MLLSYADPPTRRPADTFLPVIDTVALLVARFASGRLFLTAIDAAFSSAGLGSAQSVPGNHHA